ncbi:MAG: hypothetical protein EON58_12960 [Alphaproteobacteria bacterium]|nr:MAG: hypothetical protein EON58_12960 [Alphaproteobacteria bacterium]
MPSSQPTTGAALGCIGFGVYLLVGAFYTFSGTWPGFLPPQIDGIALLMSALSEPYATRAAGAATALLGIACVAFGIWLWTRPTVRGITEATDV